MMRSLEVDWGKCGDLDFGGRWWLRNGDPGEEVFFDGVEQLLVCLGPACDVLESAGFAKDV